MTGFSFRSYFSVFAALITLTGITVGVSTLELGAWHAPVGLLIAGIKALLVALVFMHLLKSSKITWLVALGGVFWLGILLTLSLSDFLSRGWNH